MTDILIREGYIVTVDDERRIFNKGNIAIENSKITYIGPASSGPSSADKVINAEGMLVLPGLIDCHIHPMHYLAKGTTDDMDTMDALYQVLYPYEAVMNDEDVYISAMGTFVEALKSGTTCINDPGGYKVDQTAKAIQDIGIRGIVTRSTRDLSSPGKELPPELNDNAEMAVRKNEALFHRWHGAADGRIRVWFSLRTMFSYSDELARMVKEKADSYGVGIHSHVACVKGENEAMENLFGSRCIERCHELGLLGPSSCFVHMGWVNDEEIEMLAENDVKVVHCVAASLHGAFGDCGQMTFPKMADRKITIGLGSDGATRGRFLDMVRVMYVAATVHRDLYNDPVLWGAYKTLEMATRDAAKTCLWDDEIGSLEEGKKADVVLFRMNDIEWYPLFDPVRTLIYASSGNSADTGIVDGKLLMENRRVLVVDEDEIRAAAEVASKKLMKGGGGFILGGAMPDEVKPENLKAMGDFTKKNGVYN